MRRLLVMSCLVVALVGCESSKPREVDPLEAQRASRDAWGTGFESNRYDIDRELSKDEQAKLDEELSKKAGTKLHATGTVFTQNAGPDRVVDEAKKLQPGCALSFCKTWHVEKRAGDVVETGSEKPAKPVPFSVIARDRDGKLHSSRFEATSHEEALSRR